MAFTASSCNIQMVVERMEHQGDISITHERSPVHNLKADCRSVGGFYRTCYLDLDCCIANDDGRLVWAQNGNFSRSADNGRTRFSLFGLPLSDGNLRTFIVQRNGESYLHAKVRKVNGDEVETEINLDEHITNNNGNLMLV